MEGLCVHFSKISFSSFHFCLFHSSFKSTHGLQQSQCKRGSWRCLLSRQARCRVPTLKPPKPRLPLYLHQHFNASGSHLLDCFQHMWNLIFGMFDLKLMMKPCILSCPVTLLQSVGLRALDKDLCPRHSYLCTWGPDAMHKCALPGRLCAHIVVGSCSCQSEKYCQLTLCTSRGSYHAHYSHNLGNTKPKPI